MNDAGTIFSFLPLYAVLASLLAVPLIVASRRHPNLREGWTLAAALVKFGIVGSMLPAVLNGQVFECVLMELSPDLPVFASVRLALRVDPFGIYFGLVASFLWILTAIYSIGYMRGHHEEHQTRFFASFAMSLSATLGVAFASNLLTFILFYEMLTLATYPLVVHKQSQEAIRAGRQYLAYSLSGGLALLAVAAWLYQITGSLDFSPGGILNPEDFSPTTARIIFCVAMAGVGVKAGLMPLHSWLPNAMVAPTPVSALLHAVAVVKSGAFGVGRLCLFIFGPGFMDVFGLNVILAVFAGTTVIVASLLALKQDSLKRRLAYSTVGHLSYIILGIALLTPDGILGGIYHISTHATMKITLFFCAGAIAVQAHKHNISELDGIGRAMPWTMTAFAIGALGLAGVPPVNGFFSKWFLCTGAISAEWMIALAVFLVSGLLNAGYFAPIVARAFFRRSEQFKEMNEGSGWMVIPICITAGLALLLGLAPNFGFHFFELATQVAEAVMGPIHLVTER